MSQSCAAPFLPEALGVSQRDVNISPAWRNRGTAQRVGSSTGFPALHSHSIMQVQEEQEAGLAQKPACLQEGGQAAAQQCEGREGTTVFQARLQR